MEGVGGSKRTTAVKEEEKKIERRIEMKERTLAVTSLTGVLDASAEGECLQRMLTS